MSGRSSPFFNPVKIRNFEANWDEMDRGRLVNSNKKLTIGWFFVLPECGNFLNWSLKPVIP